MPLHELSCDKSGWLSLLTFPGRGASSREWCAPPIVEPKSVQLHNFDGAARL